MLDLVVSKQLVENSKVMYWGKFDNKFRWINLKIYVNCEKWYEIPSTGLINKRWG